MDPDKKGEEIEKFQNMNYLADEEINSEFERIDTIEGSGEHLEPFMGQFEERITPQMEKTGQMMEKLMADLGGAMMGAMGEAFGEMGEASAPGKGPTQEEAPVKIPWGDPFHNEDEVVNRKISNMSFLNVICTVGDLESQKSFTPRAFEGIPNSCQN